VSLLLLVVHIGAAILFIGSATLATSAFARYAAPDTRDVASALHHFSRSYGTASLVVPAAGFALATQRNLLTEGWLLLSAALFVVALALLGGVVIPAQSRALDSLEQGSDVPSGLRTRLRVGAGLFATTWVVILILMVVKPF
jgi:uncharacterized membrane protein